MADSLQPSPASPILLSRIATCYRQWPLLAQWLDRDDLFAPQVEWFIVNDCPTDPAPDAVSKSLARRGIQVITPPSNLGRSGARNRAAALASGKYLDFIDGDDVPLPFDVQLLATGGEELIYFPVRLAVEGTITFSQADQAPLNQMTNWSDLLPTLRPFNVAPCGVAWSRKYFLNLGGFDGRFDGAEDLQIAFRADQLGFRVRRLDVPKQCHFERPLRRTFQRQHILSHRRALQFISKEAVNNSVKLLAERWLGKELAYEWVIMTRELWSQRRLLLKYIGFRLRTLF